MKTPKIIGLSKKYLMNTYKRLPIALVRGEGAFLWDTEGKKYLDFLSGIAVTNLGHAHPRILKAIDRQSKKLLHVSNAVHILPQAELARLLVQNSFADKVFFCNSGAEANEAAVKLARKYAFRILKKKRYEIVTMEKSFHGRTLGMISATGQEKVKKGFRPLLSGFRHVPFGDLKALRRAIGPKTIGVMVEPILGESGVLIPPQGFLKEVEKLCRRKKILFILDEVQSGMGRTGSLFAYEQANLRPDIMTLGKALGGGLPMAATLATNRVARAFRPGDHGSTFGGNPLVTAVAIEVVKTIKREGLSNTKKMGRYLLKRIHDLKKEFSWITEVRGRGLMVAIDLKKKSKPIGLKLAEAGLLVGSVLPKTIRFLPPLIIRKKEIDRAIQIMRKVFHEA